MPYDISHNSVRISLYDLSVHKYTNLDAVNENTSNSTNSEKLQQRSYKKTKEENRKKKQVIDVHKRVHTYLYACIYNALCTAICSTMHNII